MKAIKALVLAGICFSAPLNSSLAEQPSQKTLGVVCKPSCDLETDVEQARDYLVETARPGGTMARQGADLAIDRLHPEFAIRLAKAINAARRAGLAEAGIFSAYRPPVFGVGGFADKYYSLHAYGLAVDMFGIGRPGSPEAQKWHEIAAAHGVVCPYGYSDRVEWNHCQPTHLKAVTTQNPLRETITGAGPIDLERMFAVAKNFLVGDESPIRVIANRLQIASAAASDTKQVRTARSDAKAVRVASQAPKNNRPVRTASRPVQKVAANKKTNRQIAARSVKRPASAGKATTQRKATQPQVASLAKRAK